MKTLKKRLLAALLALCVLTLSGCNLKDLQQFVAQLHTQAPDGNYAPEAEPEEAAPSEQEPLSATDAPEAAPEEAAPSNQEPLSATDAPEAEPSGAQLTETEIDEIDGQVQTQLSAMKQAEAEFLEEDGTVLPENAQAAIDSVAAYAAEAKERGEIAGYRREENGVSMTLNSGICMVYVPRIQGMMAGGGETEIVTIEPFKSDVLFEGLTILGSFGSLSGMMEMQLQNPRSPRFRYSKRLADDQVSVDAMKRLPDHAYVLFNSHGGHTDSAGSLMLLGEEYSRNTLRDYFYDYVGLRLVVMEDGRLAVSAAFFEKYYKENALADDLFLFCCCEGMACPELAETLLKKGADAVIGSKNDLLIAYCGLMAREITQLLFQGANVTDALRGSDERIAKDLEKFVNTFSPEKQTVKGDMFVLGDPNYSLKAAIRPYNALAQARSRALNDHSSILETAREATARSGDFDYYLVGDDAVLSHYNGIASVLRVPETIDGHNVLAIGCGCFAGNQTLVNVYVPNSIQALQPYAFYECRNLRRLSLGCGINTIGYCALEGMGRTKSVDHASSWNDTRYSFRELTIQVYKDSYAAEWCADKGWPDSFVNIDYIKSAGPVVERDGSLYYWRYNADSFSDEAWRYNTDVSFHDTNLFASYMPLPEARNELVRRQPNGEEQVLLTANGCGNIAIPPSGDRIYFQYPTNSNGSKAIASVDMNGENREDFGDGSILGATLDGRTVLCSWQNNIGMCIIRDGRHQIIDRYGTFLLATDGRIFYEHEGEGATQVITSMAEDSSDALDIFSFHPPYDRFRECCQPVVRGDSLYFSYGEVSNGGNFAYVGGNIIRAKLDGSGWEIVAGENDDAAREFSFNSEGELISFNIDDPAESRAPMNEYFTRDGSVYFYDSYGAPRQVIAPSDYAQVGPGNCNAPEPSGFLCIDTGNFVVETGGHVYFLVQYGTVDEEESDDWLTAYHLWNGALLDKNLATGQVTTLFTF